jgi:hypothetical protein
MTITVKDIMNSLYHFNVVRTLPITSGKGQVEVARVVAHIPGYQWTLCPRHLDQGIKRYDHYDKGCHKPPLLLHCSKEITNKI